MLFFLNTSKQGTWSLGSSDGRASDFNLRVQGSSPCSGVSIFAEGSLTLFLWIKHQRCAVNVLEWFCFEQKSQNNVVSSCKLCILKEIHNPVSVHWFIYTLIYIYFFILFLLIYICDGNKSSKYDKITVMLWYKHGNNIKQRRLTNWIVTIKWMRHCDKWSIYGKINAQQLYIE